jgi:hypothetical protein
LTFTVEPKPCIFKGVLYDWSTAALTTYKNFRQQYGYFETRLRYKSINGMFPSFWTMPDRGLYGGTNDNYKSYLKFDLSGISSVTNAEIQLRVSSADTGTKSLNLFPVGDSWAENTITWNNMPAANPLWIAHDYAFTASAGTVLKYDVTDYINQEIAGDKVASIVAFDTFSMIAQTSFDSSEATVTANRPKLVINGTTTVTASEDAHVRSGTYANSNYGSATTLTVKESWVANNQDTFNGGMEMDIFEDYGHWGPYEFHHGIIWDGYAAQRQSVSIWYCNPTITVDEYHTYGMYWENGLIEFYVDGTNTGTFATNRVCSVPSYVLLSMQTGAWGPIPTNEYPASMEVDYVKVWSGTKQ